MRNKNNDMTKTVIDRNNTILLTVHECTKTAKLKVLNPHLL